MADPDPHGVPQDRRARRPWIRHGITLLLFSALILTAVGAYHARQQFWALYLSVMR